MAQYLSPEWFEQLEGDRTVDAHSRPTLTLQQVVTGTPGAPGGEVRYIVLVGGGAPRVRLGESPEPDMTFTSDYLTARAVAEGRLSVQAALGAGRIRIGGDAGHLATHQALLTGVDPIPAGVRADTTWSDPLVDPACAGATPDPGGEPTSDLCGADLCGPATDTAVETDG